MPFLCLSFGRVISILSTYSGHSCFTKLVPLRMSSYVQSLCCHCGGRHMKAGMDHQETGFQQEVSGPVSYIVLLQECQLQSSQGPGLRLCGYYLPGRLECGYAATQSVTSAANSRRSGTGCRSVALNLRFGSGDAGIRWHK